MASSMLIARACDGLVLSETQDRRGHVPFNATQQAVQLLGSLHAMSPRCSFEADGVIFHMLISEGVCYLGFFDYRYPKALAFSFLEEVRDLFREELKQAFGTGSVDHRSHIETITKPYYFVRFDRQILRKQVEFQEPTSSKSLSKLQGSCVQVSHGIGHISDVLYTARGVSGSASKAADSSMPSKRQANMIFAGLAALISVILVVAVVGSVAAQARESCVIGFSCLAALLVLHCLSQLRGGGRPSKPKASSEDFSCVSDYMI